jgi:hypothetical protein
MLEVCEVVDFPVESSKYIDTRIEQELEAPVQNSRNQTLRFREPDYLILSGLNDDASPPDMRRLDER